MQEVWRVGKEVDAPDVTRAIATIKLQCIGDIFCLSRERTNSTVTGC